MKKLMQYLFLSCYKATSLIEKRIYSKLTFKEEVQLKIHKMMCDACSNYEKDSLLIDKALHKRYSTPPEIKGVDMDAFEKKHTDKLNETGKL